MPKVQFFLVFDGFFYYNLKINSLRGSRSSGQRGLFSCFPSVSYRFLKLNDEFFKQPISDWRVSMKKLFTFILMGLLLIGQTTTVRADGAVTKVQRNLVLLDTDRGVGNIGDVVPVFRLTSEGWQRVGEVKIVKFGRGRSAARIVRQQSGNPITINDVVKTQAPEQSLKTPVQSGMTSPVSSTPKLSIGIGLPYTQIGGDFDGLRIARASDLVASEAPFFVPDVSSNFGVAGWAQFGFGERMQPFSGIRAGYMFSMHQGTWKDTVGLFRRNYLTDAERSGVEGMKLQYHKIFLNAMFEIYKTNRFKIIPAIGLNWEILRFKNVVIDAVETDHYAERSPFVSDVFGEDTDRYFGISPNKWLYNYVFGVEIGLDFSYSFSYELALDLGLRYTVYNDVLPVKGAVYRREGNAAQSLSTNSFNVFLGLCYSLDLVRLMR